MKKLSIMAIALCTAFGAGAQTALVKDAQKSFKDGADYAAWLKTLEPAFTNPETAEQAFTYYVPAKTGFDNFAYLYTLARAGQSVDVPNMGNSLMQGYEFALKALPFDSLPDAKGKVKPKYSKELIGLVAANYNNFDQAARFLYNDHKWNEAAAAWDIYFAIPKDPRFAGKVKADPDSVQAQNAMLQAYVVSAAEDYPRALGLFERAIAMNALDANMFKQALYVAKMAKNEDKMYDFAEKAYAKVGTAEPLFFQLTIEGKLRNKDYDSALALLNQALAQEPDNAVYNVAMGTVLEDQGKKDEALSYYRKAAEKNPDSAQAWFNLGRALAEKSDAIGESAGAGTSEAEYRKLENEQINPLRRQAAEAFEKAYAIDENHTALQYLKNIYYVLHDDANYERVNNLY